MTTIFIGPYLVVPPALLKGTRHERFCAKHCAAPEIRKPAKFCGHCGGAVVEQDVPTEEMKPLPIWELDNRWTDFMHRPEYGQRHPKGDIWLPNRGGHGMSFESGSEDVFTPVLLSDINGNAMLEKAQRAYGKFIEALKKDFGVGAFWEVGVLAYAG